MRTWISIVAGGLVGALVGAAAFWAAIGPLTVEDARFGPWTTNMAVGIKQQSAYSRAKVAIGGIWGLPPSEVLYFVAAEDSAGAPFDSRCTYEVSGGDLPTRWWSLTLYKDGFYIANPANRYSWSASDVARQGERWTIRLSPHGEGRNALAFTEAEGKPSVLLRLYQAFPEVIEDRRRVPLPTIRKTACPSATGLAS